MTSLSIIPLALPHEYNFKSQLLWVGCHRWGQGLKFVFPWDHHAVFLRLPFKITRVVWRSQGHFEDAMWLSCNSYDCHWAYLRAFCETLNVFLSRHRTTRTSSVLSYCKCFMSFHEVCHFVSNLPATDRRQKIVRQQNRTSDVNTAVTLVRKVYAGCQHDKLNDQRVSACACFQNFEKNRTNLLAKLSMPRNLSAPIDMSYGFTILYGGLPTALQNRNIIFSK